jgi:hypothetical protein
MLADTCSESALLLSLLLLASMPTVLVCLPKVLCRRLLCCGTHTMRTSSGAS